FRLCWDQGGYRRRHSYELRTLRATCYVGGTTPVIRRRPYCSSARRLAANQFLQPPAMVSPRPATGDLATGHRADPTPHPDCRIDVRDPDTNRDHGSARMHQNGNASLLDREVWAEVLIPDDDAARDQHNDQRRHRPENQLLPGIVFADLGQVFLMAGT